MTENQSVGTSLGGLALLVPDYDEAIAYFTGALGFSLLEDTALDGGKRWVVVRAPQGGARIVLAKAKNDHQKSFIGNQAGGRVWLFLDTANFDETYRQYQAAGVEFLEPPRVEAFGKVAVFVDCFGNKWDLVERGGEVSGGL